MMTVGELIEMLENFDPDMPVVIGMIQRYGSNFAMNICDGVEQYNICKFYGDDIEAVVLTEGNQIGVVEYNEW